VILTDQPRAYSVSDSNWAHLVSDTSLAELHEFAARLGLNRAWFQQGTVIPHYDITESKWRKAVEMGAEVVSYHRLVLRAATA